MHDFAMPLDHGLENDKGVEAPGQPNNDSGRREVLTTAHVGALTTCLTSIHGIFNSFLRFQPQDVRTLPIFHFPRLARATVLLIRMYFAATIADSELGKVMPSDHMKAEFYLTNLIELLRAAASDEKCHPAHKLSMVLAVMQVYFERSKALKTGVIDEILVGEKVDAQPVDSENLSSKQEYRKMQLEVNDYRVRASPPKEPAPAPHLAPSVLGDRALHMLSDVAMGSSANGHPTPNGADGWYGYHHGGLGGPGPVYSGEFYQAPVGGVEAYAGLHGMHPDLEQAIGMALGDGDLNIMDDAGFYHIMQAAPSLFGHIG